MQLLKLGWTPQLAAQHQALYPDLIPGRVSAEFREAYSVLWADGELSARIDGRLRHAANDRNDFPSVGDWVVFSRAGSHAAMIRAILPRKNHVTRQAAGAATKEQIIGANIDTMFLVSALSGDFNPRRIERYVALAFESQTRPVIVLNKADLCVDLVKRLDEIHTLSERIPTHVISAIHNDGLQTLAQYLEPGQTVCVVGSSGVGKSTLINALMRATIAATGEVRESDGRGRHITTHRSLFALPTGALLLDTPGMRELQLWAAESGLRETFADIEALARQCRFSDCSHDSEPGCAVQDARTSGLLDEARFRNYKKLERELEFQARKTNAKAEAEHKQHWKAIHRLAREQLRFKKG